ncbi:MAG: glycoside hydrolase family 25 protein [Clostridium sp.]|nr:glycoside hydrolase family 25 protein [Clostridium sp.]
MLNGIDVSEHQGVINWDSVKSSGIDYAIIRVGYGDDIFSQDDRQFKRNADECTRVGLPFGVYIYSYATSIDQSRSEAQHVLRLIKNYKLSYPVYYDLEDSGTTGQCSNSFIADMAQNFCNIIKSSGYVPGVYANTNWWNNKLTDGRFNSWQKWVAQYASRCTYSGDYGMWQYASDGRVNGINGNVDVNYCYIDYPSMMNRNDNGQGEKVIIRGIVAYQNDPEVSMAVELARKLGYVAIWCGTPMDYSVLPQENIWAIGGDRGSYTGYLLEDHFISGANRDETAIKFGELLEKL